MPGLVPDRRHAASIGSHREERLRHATRHPEDDLLLLADHPLEHASRSGGESRASRPASTQAAPPTAVRTGPARRTRPTSVSVATMEPSSRRPSRPMPAAATAGTTAARPWPITRFPRHEHAAGTYTSAPTSGSVNESCARPRRSRMTEPTAIGAAVAVSGYRRRTSRSRRAGIARGDVHDDTLARRYDASGHRYGESTVTCRASGEDGPEAATAASRRLYIASKSMPPARCFEWARRGAGDRVVRQLVCGSVPRRAAAAGVVRQRGASMKRLFLLTALILAATFAATAQSVDGRDNVSLASTHSTRMWCLAGRSRA